MRTGFSSHLAPAWALSLLVLALALSLLAAGVVSGEDSAPTLSLEPVPIPVKVLTLNGYAADETPSFPGRVEAGDSALLAFRVAGQLQELNVRMGNRVEEGDLLAQLDPTDYQLNVDAREAEFEVAQLEAERAGALYKQRLISEDQYDSAQTLLATSQAKMEQAREQLSFCKLKAPFAGAIAFTYAMPSEVVGPQQPILNLQDISVLEIQFNLPPRYQPLLQGEKQAAFSVTFELMPDVPLEARYKEVGMQPDPDTNSYPVVLRVDSPSDFSARPGMPVTVRLHHPGLSSSRWVLPREALFDRSGEKAHVWRIDPSTMTIHKALIELDASGALLTGLKRGDSLVAAGVGGLHEGQRVKPWVREGGL